MKTRSKTKEVKLIPIGNSKGIRIPKATIQKYGFSDTLLIEETDRGIFLHGKENDNKLSWEDSFKSMAEEKEDWSAFDSTLLDGIDD